MLNKLKVRRLIKKGREGPQGLDLKVVFLIPNLVVVMANFKKKKYFKGKSDLKLLIKG